MSVINKMLRDLDSRQAAGTIPVQTGESRTRMARGTLSVNESDHAGRRRASLPVIVLVATTVVVLGGAGAWWYLTHNQTAQRKVEQVRLAPTPISTPAPAQASATPVLVAAPAAAPDPAPAIQPQVVAPVTVAAAVPVLAHTPVDPAPVPQKVAIVVPPVTAKLPVVESGARADVSLKLDSRLKGVPSPDAAARPPTPAPAAGMLQPVPERSLSEPPMKERPMTSASTVAATTTAVPPGPSRQSPALDALAQAQSLWNSGSHAAAIELAREALAAAERAGTSTGNTSVLATLARELARMELAEGRISQALEMLTRLQPALAGVADVWALRGNAAQRLGRHPESAAAYLMALKLRPNEGRWMLGAAVSLAAQGQTAEAAELAEKARSGGVLSPEVATYLRQLGVPLRER